MARARDPVPDAVRAAAHAALDWRTLDAELAELVADTAAADEELAHRAQRETDVLLSFAAGDLSVELEIRATPEGRELMGQRAAAAARRRDARAPRGRARPGRGRPRPLLRRRARPGPARLRVRVDSAAGARRVATPWTML